MADYIFPDFESQELAISSAISQLKRHGININLPEQLQKSIKAHILFDGDDGLFKEILRNTDTYFEYGCGKSTEFVYKYTNASIYAVDTSRDWVNKLQGIAITSASRRVNLNWVDVGKVADWGYPISFERRENFRVYAELMWRDKISPDLVLIDGRFRVFCFLTSIKFAPTGTKILFDDYTNRPFYHVVEEFCERIDTCGRQALFEVSQSAKSKVTDEILSTFQNVIE
jgi:hypothetical protein